MGNAGDIFIDDGTQIFVADEHLVLSLNAGNPGIVVGGKGVKHIGLGNQADIKALLSLVKLLLQGAFLGFGRQQGIFRLQYGKVSLGNVQDQLLLGIGKYC